MLRLLEDTDRRFWWRGWGYDPPPRSFPLPPFFVNSTAILVQLAGLLLFVYAAVSYWHISLIVAGAIALLAAVSHWHNRDGNIA